MFFFLSDTSRVIVSAADLVDLLQHDSQLVFSTVHANKEELTNELSIAMQRLWADQGVQDCYLRSNEYQVDDSAKQ